MSFVIMTKTDLLYELTRLARPLHQQVEAAIAAMLSGTSITVRMRAVLDTLAESEGATVPQVARTLGIKRQYVQVMMNEVEDAGLVVRQANPAHRRSALFVLSEAGEQVINGIRRAEMHVIESLGRALSHDEVEKAHHVIEHALRGFKQLNTDLKS